jgi:Reeler domain
MPTKKKKKKIAVTLDAADGRIFRGFILQARNATGTPIGTFDASGAAQATDCPPGIRVLVQNSQNTRHLNKIILVFYNININFNDNFIH